MNMKNKIIICSYLKLSDDSVCMTSVDVRPVNTNQVHFGNCSPLWENPFIIIWVAASASSPEHISLKKELPVWT